MLDFRKRCASFRRSAALQIGARAEPGNCETKIGQRLSRGCRKAEKRKAFCLALSQRMALESDKILAVVARFDVPHSRAE